MRCFLSTEEMKMKQTNNNLKEKTLTANKHVIPLPKRCIQIISYFSESFNTTNLIVHLFNVEKVKLIFQA